jgi:hypothetical protein
MDHTHPESFPSTKTTKTKEPGGDAPDANVAKMSSRQYQTLKLDEHPD